MHLRLRFSVEVESWQALSIEGKDMVKVMILLGVGGQREPNLKSGA